MAKAVSVKQRGSNPRLGGDVRGAIGNADVIETVLGQPFELFADKLLPLEPSGVDGAGLGPIMRKPLRPAGPEGY